MGMELYSGVYIGAKLSKADFRKIYERVAAYMRAKRAEYDYGDHEEPTYPLFESSDDWLDDRDDFLKTHNLSIIDIDDESETTDDESETTEDEDDKATTYFLIINKTLEKRRKSSGFTTVMSLPTLEKFNNFVTSLDLECGEPKIICNVHTSW